MFDVYITFIIENYVLYCLAWFYEIRHFDNSTSGREISGIISLLITFWLFIFIAVGFIQWLIARSPEQYHKLYFFRNYFEGIKPTNWKRLYMVYFLARRFILISIVTFGKSIEFELKLTIFCIIQFLYIIAILLNRFHINLDLNINESINEWCYLILLIILIFLNKKKDWNSRYDQLYMSIITIDSILFVLISAIAFSIKLVKSWRKRRREKQTKLELDKARQIQKESEMNVNINDFYKPSSMFYYFIIYFYRACWW